MMVPEQRELVHSYGQSQMEVLAKHYFKDKPEEGDRLKAEWEGLKYHIRDGIRPHIPESVASPTSLTSPTEWCIIQLLKNTAVRHLYPTMMYILEIVASLPVSNAWPERGASTLKAVKTRLRNRLGTTMLESLMHVCINGPELNSPEAQERIKEAVQLWLEKDRRKVPRPPKQARSVSAHHLLVDAEVQTESTEQSALQSDELIQTAVDIALQKLNLASKDFDTESESEFSDDCCGNL